MAYNNVGKIDPWHRKIRKALSKQTLLVIGTGNIGSRVIIRMKNFMNIITYDIIQNKEATGRVAKWAIELGLMV